VSVIVILLLEDSDGDAERILAALSEGGPECLVHRARTQEGLAAFLSRRPVDLVLAAGRPPKLDACAVLALANARCPAAPVVVVASDPSPEEAEELLARGAAGYVPEHRLAGLGAAVQRAVDEAVLRAERRRVNAALRFLTELLGRTAHELRTPLNAVLGWASMLRTRRLDEAGRERALSTIERSARAQARLIEDLLDVSRVLTQSLRLEVIDIELCPVVAAAVESARQAAEAKALALSASLDDTAGSVAGDPARLRQVLHELIANAIRATPRGGRVGVLLGRSGDVAEITVSDTGRGIGGELLPHLFDGSPCAGARRGSLGVGLIVARHVIEAHGGALVAESAGEGRGATFTVRLPIVDRP
jgi:signal transduction histidine kinase